MSATAHRYHYPRLDDIEDLEQYRPGGLHPVALGDVFAGGRYTVLHKLGSGGAATVWLARERAQGLVSLKVMAAEQSATPPAELADLCIPHALDAFAQATHHPARENVLAIRDHFVHEGPNGAHRCLISQFAGPSVVAMADCPGRVAGSRRLRGDLARKAARQVADAVDLCHSAGVVHGDLTAANVLFRVSDVVRAWADDDVYQMLGSPVTDDVYTHDDSPPGPHAPAEVVAPIDVARLSSPRLLQESVLLIDFGQSLFAARPPPSYEPATPFHYLAPEAYFDSTIGFASDVWALACVLFETRAGAPLFDPFLSSEATILKQVVETLGRLPDPWWGAWDARHTWFDEAGAPRPEEEQKKQGLLLTAARSSLRQKVQEIGQQDSPPEGDEGRMIEETGTRVDEREVALLADLLEGMLRYRPEERMSMKEVVRHPWFGYN